MGSHELTVKLDADVFAAETGDNLLSSLLSQGADVRYGCRAGACGACRLYDLNNCESLLSCQTSIFSDMALSTQTPAASAVFSVLALNSLDDSNIEITLLGPSDDSFGDRVFVSASQEYDSKAQNFVECMVLNQAGAPLKVILQKGAFSKDEWQKITALVINDSLGVQTLSGVRKGRLLYEMDLSAFPVLIVSSSDNGVFESYWREVLGEISTQKKAFFKLTSGSLGHPLEDEVFITFLNEIVAESGTSLHIIYHGQNLPEKDWEQALRPFRIRTSQLYFVR
ncbi:2Fe-2S iron-sulfur cluster binding domain-containing protein [Marinomonas sp. 5E14-1]|uniref:2Fe-2S iron-sulfur cluster binding domain-containing protein n=1 Tax=Marinomonas sp. 5E14-1 TaxID=3153922 RepID=UPI00326784BF